MQIFRENVLETEEPIRVGGTDLVAKGCFVKGTDTDKGKALPEWFLDKTLILGYDKNLSMSQGTAEWEFIIPKSISKSIYQGELIIETFRYQAGLHSWNQHSKASVYINNKKIELFMDNRMPYGLDYGFERIVSFRVESFIKDTSLKVKLCVKQVFGGTSMR
jgi:hypothetical protein